MEFCINSATVKSRWHEKNEDCFICNDKYIVVADGMGGEACGEVASNIAISTISSCLDGHIEEARSEDDIRKLMFSAISRADGEILRYVASHPDADGMGTTVVIMVRREDNMYVAWCGDSRCYYYDPSKRLCSLTVDHSYVQQLIEQGKITEDESFTHPDNNLITKYVGGGEDTCTPEFVSSRIEDDGSIILCSDGLSGYCRTEEIERELQSDIHGELPARLMRLALSKGSDDDTTIVTLTPKTESSRPKGPIRSWFKKLTH